MNSPPDSLAAALLGALLDWLGRREGLCDGDDSEIEAGPAATG